MPEEFLHQRGTTLVRRLSLAPGEATKWHHDPCHRVTVVFKGDALSIEFRDGRPPLRVDVAPGMVDWEEPSSDVHRAINTGNSPYEEITVFFLANPDDVPQPESL